MIIYLVRYQETQMLIRCTGPTSCLVPLRKCDHQCSLHSSCHSFFFNFFFKKAYKMRTQRVSKRTLICKVDSHPSNRRMSHCFSRLIFINPTTSGFFVRNEIFDEGCRMTLLPLMCIRLWWCRRHVQILGPHDHLFGF